MNVIACRPIPMDSMLYLRRAAQPMTGGASVSDIIPLILTFLPLLILFFLFVVPILFGFAWMRIDADHYRQPGVLWALLTIPLGWLTVLVYLAMRSTWSRSI